MENKEVGPDGKMYREDFSNTVYKMRNILLETVSQPLEENKIKRNYIELPD